MNYGRRAIAAVRRWSGDRLTSIGTVMLSRWNRIAVALVLAEGESDLAGLMRMDEIEPALDE